MVNEKKKHEKISFAAKCVVILFKILFFFLIKVKNSENLTTSKQRIFAFNHNSSYETIMVYIALSMKTKFNKIRFIIDWMFAHIPVLGPIIRLSEPILVFNKKARIKRLNRKKILYQNPYIRAIQTLEENASIGLYPEGTRNRKPDELIKARRGIGKIAIESKKCVLPVGLDFPKRRKKGKIPVFGRIILNVGKPMNFQEEVRIAEQAEADLSLNIDEKARVIKYLESLVTYKIMIEISKLSGKEYPFEKPVSPELVKKYLN